MIEMEDLASRELLGRDLVSRSVDSAASMNGFQWTVISIALVMVICRIYARCFRQRNAGLDDAFIVVAMGLSIFGGICGLFFTHYGIGRHVWELNDRQKSGASKWMFISMLESYISLFFVRLSIGCFILRMLQNTRFRLRLAVYVGMALNLAVTIMVVTVYSLWCRPIKGVWDRTVHAKCLTSEVLDDSNRAFSSISAAVDVLFCCLPISIVWRLKLDRTTKINLTIVLMFGFITCACAIGKAITVNEKDPDFTYANVPATYWAIAEDNVGIIAACLPALRQFFLVTKKDVRDHSNKLFLSRMSRAPNSLPRSDQSTQPTSEKRSTVKHFAFMGRLNSGFFKLRNQSNYS